MWALTHVTEAATSRRGLSFLLSPVVLTNLWRNSCAMQLNVLLSWFHHFLCGEELVVEVLIARTEWTCRYSDPDSGASSFSMLLGDAPHLDEQVLHVCASSGW